MEWTPVFQGYVPTLHAMGLWMVMVKIHAIGSMNNLTQIETLRRNGELTNILALWIRPVQGRESPTP